MLRSRFRGYIGEGRLRPLSMCVGGRVPESIATSVALLYLVRRPSHVRKFRGIGREARRQVRRKLPVGKGKRDGRLPTGSVVIIFSAINMFLRPRSCGGEVKRNPAFLPSRIYIRRRKGEGGRSIPGICVNLGNHFGILYTFERIRRPLGQVLYQLFPESV